MIVLQGSMPDICKRCKERGGLEDGLYRVHTEEDYVNFYCDGQSQKTCPIIGEIPDKHGRLIDADALVDALRKQVMVDIPYRVKEVIENQPTVLEASK